MTSSGANTWSVPLEINNLESQITSGTSGVQSITAGTNISLTGTASNPIINSTGGVSSITAGTNITIGGTASVPIINATSTGVQSVSAGTNTTITGTPTNPIINLTPASLPAGVSIDALGADLLVLASQLANCYLYSSVTLTAPITVRLPSYQALFAEFGENAVIPFTWGNFRQNSPTNATVVAEQPFFLGAPLTAYFNQTVTGAGWAVSAPQQVGFVLTESTLWKGTCVLDSLANKAYYSFTWLSPVS